MFVPCSVQINRLPRFFRSFSNWKKFDRSRNVIFPVCRVNEYTGGYAREEEDRSVERKRFDMLDETALNSSVQ